MDINGKTKLVCLLGNPVGHSFSPYIHNAGFKNYELNMIYTAFAVDDQEVANAVAGIRALGFKGSNVTIPHKEAVIHHLDEVDEVAASLGAVNTIVNENGKLTGYYFVALYRLSQQHVQRPLFHFPGNSDTGKNPVDTYQQGPERKQLDGGKHLWRKSHAG